MSVTAVRAGATIRVEVCDPGPGGARIVPGAGLAGLTDRAQAIGGSLHVDSPLGGPTSVCLVLPLSRPSQVGHP